MRFICHSLTMMASFTRFLLLFTAFSLFMPSFSVDVSYDGRSLKIDEKPKIILSGSIHYPRSTPEVSCKLTVVLLNFFFYYELLVKKKFIMCFF